MDTSLVEALFAMARGREVASGPHRPASELQDLLLACLRHGADAPPEPQPTAVEPSIAPVTTAPSWLW